MLYQKRAVLENAFARMNRCEQCPDRTFSGSGNLKKRRRTHIGERPFACTECAMKFTQKASLQAHHRAKHTVAFLCHFPSLF